LIDGENGTSFSLAGAAFCLWGWGFSFAPGVGGWIYHTCWKNTYNWHGTNLDRHHTKTQE